MHSVRTVVSEKSLPNAFSNSCDNYYQHASTSNVEICFYDHAQTGLFFSCVLTFIAWDVRKKHEVELDFEELLLLFSVLCMVCKEEGRMHCIPLWKCMCVSMYANANVNGHPQQGTPGNQTLGTWLTLQSLQSLFLPPCKLSPFSLNNRLLPIHAFIGMQLPNQCRPNQMHHPTISI